MEAEIENKEGCFIRFIFSNGITYALYHRTNTGGGEYASSHAYPGVYLRIRMWLAVWYGNRFYHPAPKKCFIRYATYGS